MPRDAKSKTIPVACFAPPLTDALLAKYTQLAAAAEHVEVRDALHVLLACVKKWWELPESTEQPSLFELYHVDRKQKIRVPETPLSAELVEHLFDVTPWMRELDTLSTPADTGVFDHLPPGELRDAAFHLLWHAKELTLDREPMTRDKVPT